jgi:putative ATPase
VGYGANYEYPHDAPEQFVATRNLPEALGPITFYEPKREGAEGEIAERLAKWRARRGAGDPTDEREDD